MKTSGGGEGAQAETLIEDAERGGEAKNPKNEPSTPGPQGFSGPSSKIDCENIVS